MESLKIDKIQLMLGTLFLVAGTLEYLVDRPIGSTHFLAEYGAIHSFFRNLPNLYGKLGMFAPQFFHPLAFSLITAALLRNGESKIMACFAWFFANILFELGQTFDAELFGYLPDILTRVPVIRGFANALVHGTFDPYDLVAVALGSSAALLIVLYTYNKECSYEKSNSKTY